MKYLVFFITCLLLVSPLLALTVQGEQKFDLPIREHALIVSDQGYFPNQISIFEGEKLRLFITSTKSTPSCLLVKGTDIHMTAMPRSISEAEYYFVTPGEYTFYCPTEKFEGKISVLPRKNLEKKVKRKIASETEVPVHVWMPKETP